MVELRRFNRAPLGRSCRFAARSDSPEHVTAVARDISLGGMFVETRAPLRFGQEIVVFVALPGHDELRLPGVVRWTNSEGVGVQFGLLGARETHAITEIVRQRSSR